ncbi:MAG: PH domain-containing protein [Bacillus sp. (in: firmicutes)]
MPYPTYLVCHKQLTKSYRTVALNKIQNIQRRTTILHRMGRATSLTLETGETSDESSISFVAISEKEADWIERSINGNQDILEKVVKEEMEGNENDKERIIHFKAVKKDLIRASFTSLSFLAIIPFFSTVYFHIDDVFRLDTITEDIVHIVFRYWWVIFLVFVVFLIAGILFGIVRTFWKYGNYEISSDANKIYIKKGLVEEISFSILKEKVQAIEIKQTLMKRLLRITEVKLISAGDTGESELETNSLYPFLPNKRAYEIIHELLPEYEVEQVMERLSKKALIARLVRPSYLWIVATLAIMYFWPSFWYVSVIIFIFMYLHRVLDFLHSGYVINNEFIQIKKGSFSTTMFMTKRKKVIEIEVLCTKWQRFFGLATIDLINRSKPIIHTNIKDIPLHKAASFYTWYQKRIKEISTKLE